jgi:hypothetical protein
MFAVMNDGHNFPTDGRDGEKDLPPWPGCEVFCIQSYAGNAGSPCGWRGRIADAARDDTGTKLLCPRCRCATLLRIPGNL